MSSPGSCLCLCSGLSKSFPVGSAGSSPQEGFGKQHLMSDSFPYQETVFLLRSFHIISLCVCVCVYKALLSKASNTFPFEATCEVGLSTQIVFDFPWKFSTLSVVPWTGCPGSPCSVWGALFPHVISDLILLFCVRKLSWIRNVAFCSFSLWGGVRVHTLGTEPRAWRTLCKHLALSLTAAQCCSLSSLCFHLRCSHCPRAGSPVPTFSFFIPFYLFLPFLI